MGVRRLLGIERGDAPAQPSGPADTEADTAAAEIRESGLFDPAWYLERNPDVAAAGVDPLDHYVTAGAREGRHPGPRFDPLWYLGEHPDAVGPGEDPLLHYLRVGRELGYSPTALGAAQAFDSFHAASRAGALPFAGPWRDNLSHVHYPLASAQPDGLLRLPPIELARRIGAMTLDDFVAVGRDVKATIVRCLPPGFDFRGKRVLDFGCGIGRVIRHFGEEARGAEIWGADIDGTSIRWAVENLTPPFRFYQMSDAPHLPFEDSSVDLVYNIAVFSQVYENWHHWAAELRRILKPGGVLFMSYAGGASFESLMGRPYAEAAPDFGLYVCNPFNSWNRGGPMVFMSLAWLERFWGSLFDIDFVAPDALNADMSFAVMRKPAFGAPPSLGLRVVETATRQAFNPDGVGRIFGSFDETKPFTEAFGVEVAGQGAVEGWIALRGDTPARLDLSVGDAGIASETVFEPGTLYRDWPDTLQFAFRTQFDATPLPRGRGRIAVAITGERGTAHGMSMPLRVA